MLALSHKVISTEEQPAHNVSTNRSCLLYGPGDARYEDRPVPALDDRHDVLIRIAFVGVCGSDVHFWRHGGITRKVSEEQPLVMGHEASGVIEAVGASVTRVRPGDRVAIEPGFPCRRCPRCRAGKYNLCRAMRFAADPPFTHGALCRVFRAPEDFVYRIPEDMSLQEAVLVEPLAVAVHGARLAAVRPGQTVLVQGAGTVGLLAAAVSRAYGARRIIVVDVKQQKLDFAASFVGCETWLCAGNVSPSTEATNILAASELEDGVDVVLECTGVESSVQTGLHALTPGGTFVQIGMGKASQLLPLGGMMEKEVVVKTAFRYGAGDYDTALGLLEAKKVSVKQMISSTVPFERATEAWDRTMRGDGIKNLIRGVEG